MKKLIICLILSVLLCANVFAFKIKDNINLAKKLLQYKYKNSFINSIECINYACTLLECVIDNKYYLTIEIKNNKNLKIVDIINIK